MLLGQANIPFDLLDIFAGSHGRPDSRLDVEDSQTLPNLRATPNYLKNGAPVNFMRNGAGPKNTQVPASSACRDFKSKLSFSVAPKIRQIQKQLSAAREDKSLCGPKGSLV